MLNRIKIITALVVALASIGSILFGIAQRKENNRLGTLLHKTEITYKDKLGRTVTETQQLNITLKELREIRRKDSTKMTQLEKDILKASRVIADLGLKARDVESVTKGDMETHSTHETSYTMVPLVRNDSIPTLVPRIDPIHTKFLDIAFTVDSVGKILVDHRYKNTFYIVLDRQKERKDGTKIKHPRLPWRWCSPWVYNAKVVSEDTTAQINNFININF